MAATCHLFVQNAWKRDLCSNCFKSKEEHSATGTRASDGRSRYLAVLPGRPLPWRRDKNPQSILKDCQAPSQRPKGAGVHFPAEESQVIGFGGDECFSSDGEDTDTEPLDTVTVSDDDVADGEDERALQRLTRSNTDFNTVAANLQGNGTEPRKGYSQLLLGQPLKDSEGRKKTLLVSVKPFGDELDPTFTSTKQKNTNTELPEKSKKIIAKSGKPSGIPIDKNGDIVLTSIKSTEQECKDNTETGMVEISELDQEPAVRAIPVIVTEEEVIVKTVLQEVSSNISLSLITDTIQKSVDISEETIITKSPSKENISVEEKTSRIPVIKNRTVSEKPKTVIRTSAFNGRSDLPAIIKPADKTEEDIAHVVVEGKTDEHNSKKQILKVTHSTSKEEQEEDTIPKLTETCETDKLSKPEEKIDVPEVNNKQTTIIETHNLDVKSAELVSSKSVILETKKDLSHTMQIKFGGLYKKLTADDKKAVCTLSVRKIEVQDGQYRASKVMLDDVTPPPRESRELAGEPDGRADSDEMPEPPELPRSPPPVLDPRPSFLHGLIQSNLRKTLPVGDKPKIPVKPNNVLQRRTPVAAQPPTTPVPSEAVEVPQAETPGFESCRTPKRQAPKPPSPQIDDSSSVLPLFTRNPSAGQSTKSSPVSREKEKRERASSCSPKMRDTVSETPAPEPAPRRSLSLSVESIPPEPESKKKSHRFSLRKFLRFGSSHKDDASSAPPSRAESAAQAAPLPRPRLEIIHPLELNGSAVEVVRGDRKLTLEDSASLASSSSDTKDVEVMSSDSANSQSSNSPTHSTTARPSKPPPPPRSQSLDAWGKTLEGLHKPARPPPPKSTELLRQLKQPVIEMVVPAPTDSLYANLGEVRSALAPNKPQRTASIRDNNTDGPKRKPAQSEDSGYESVELTNGKPVVHQGTGENVYECVGTGRSSSPECDSKPVRYGSPQRRSEGSMDVSAEFLKFRGSFVRSTSLPYCGSETESDIYSPYSFYGSEEGGEEESEWGGHPWKTSRLRLRKGRSIVHKSLEDNYGAVVVANHEALAQVLEQVNLGAVVAPALRGLKTAVNLRWTDFTHSEDSWAVSVGRRVFHPAQWASQHVTLCLTVDQGLQSGLSSRGGTSTLTPLTEFSDLVPAHYLPGHAKGKAQLTQASVAVLSKLHVDTIRSYGSSLSGEEHWRDASFVLLQLVNGLKLLQAQGIEEASRSLSSFVLCREDRDPQPRLCVLPELQRLVNDEEKVSLCQCALAALNQLVPSSPLAPLIAELLAQERAVSLSRVKSVLEFSLWGPADVALGVPPTDRELALQRWLDLERATVLHGLVRTRVELTPFEECHLLFLVRTNAKMMCEASLLLDKHKNPESTSF